MRMYCINIEGISRACVGGERREVGSGRLESVRIIKDLSPMV
jgi:hypothetical protein